MAVLYRFDAGRKSIAYPIAEDLVPVGRDLTNQIVLTDQSVSRFQFLLCRLGSGYLLQDAGSRFGTFINGKRVIGPTVLRSGSWIAVGALRLLHWDGPALRPLASEDGADNKVELHANEKESAVLSARRRRVE